MSVTFLIFIYKSSLSI